MTAPFAAELCGYREGRPSTSDASAPGSIESGTALFDELEVPRNQPAGTDAGARLELLTLAHLKTIRPDLDMQRSRLSSTFVQYTHLAAFEQFQRAYKRPVDALERALGHLDELPRSRSVAMAKSLIERAKRQAAADHQIVVDLRGAMAQESLLKLDLTIGNGDAPPKLLLAASCKWTLRTDRAQDCISQGNKLVALRRGQMPHYAAITMEPRPSMLELLAYGSGALDCVYHVALPELMRAAAAIEGRRSTKPIREQRSSLELMVAQGRLRSYGQLVTEVSRLPADPQSSGPNS